MPAFSPCSLTVRGVCLLTMMNCSEGDADQVSVTDKQRAGEDDDEQVVPIGPAIAQSEDVKIDFLDGRALGDTSTVFTLRTPTAKDLKGLEQANLTGSTIVGWQKLQALDGNCAKVRQNRAFHSTAAHD